MSLTHGYLSRPALPSSPAGQRIWQAGEEYARRQVEQQQRDSYATKKLLKQLEETQARLRRQRIYDKVRSLYPQNPQAEIEPEERVWTMLEVSKKVCEARGITLNEMRSERKELRIVRPRQEAMYWCFELTVRTSTEIGRFFNRHHSSALHARDIHAERIANGEIDALFEMPKPLLIEGDHHDQTS